MGEVEAQQVNAEAEKNTAQPQKDNAEEGTIHPDNKATTTTQTTTTEATPKPAPLSSFDGAADERPTSTSTSITAAATSTAIPPERMERLPSYVETDEGEPQVQLSKEERAAILQITVLSSPVRGKGVEE
ncbi:hypothetical protein V493_05604 [Pseudogymnoascus sp. VKM F-4281 (FW-2241)]|nr:hypothetical protein V493_05604 [Pseudogymnoascus sp. VKM F-4281 (FW-2241)]